MILKPTGLKGAYIIIDEPIADDRGSFSRLFCEKEFEKIGHQKKIVQINHSISKKAGTVRGMHFQLYPFKEIKIVRCIKGKVFDVIVDVRKCSESFGKWIGEELSPENNKMMYVPEGFAHGFQALEDNSEIIYFVSEFYNKEKESGLNIKDPELNIDWPLKPENISEKDMAIPFLKESDFEGV